MDTLSLRQAGTGAGETILAKTGLLLFTDICPNCHRQQSYDPYGTKEQCCKGKLAAHPSYNHIPSASKYSFFQSVNL